MSPRAIRFTRPLRADTRGIGVAGLLVLAYLGCEWLSEVHEYKGLPVTAWNPGLGLVFATMMHRPAAGAAILFLAIVLAERFVVHSVLNAEAIVALAAITSASYGLAAFVVRRHCRIDLALERLRDVAGLLIAGILAAVTNATLLTVLFVAIGHMTWADLTEASLPLLVGDVIGIAVVTPPVLRWLAGGLFRHGSPGVSYVIGGIAAPAIAIGVVLWLTLRGGDPAAIGYLYVLCLPVVGAALWLGLDGACASLIISQLLSIVLLHLFGYDAWAFTRLQAVMTILSATGLLCGTVVSERNAATRRADLARAVAADREAEAIRADRFGLATGMTSALSHEIAQPITAARAQARAAELRLDAGTPPDPERLREHLRAAVAQIDLAADILSRMRAFIGRGTPDQQPSSIAVIIEDAMVLIGPRAVRHGVVIETRIAADIPLVPCDRIQIQQVLMNLVGNAIDAVIGEKRIAPATATHHVVISAGMADGRDRVILSVRDRGPGIPTGLASRVFEPLMTAKSDGLGLGLSVCSLIVEAHGGRIWLEGTSPGTTEFRFWLPVRA